MDTSDLESALRNVTTSATRREAGEARSDKDWGRAQILAHLVAANRGLTEFVARVMAGAESAAFTNHGALQRPYLDAIVRASGPTDVLREFERTSQELLDVCMTLDDSALQVEIETAFWEGDEVVFEGRVPLSQLLNSIVPGHLEGHAQQLASLS
jgi:hypothetical protein